MRAQDLDQLRPGAELSPRYRYHSTLARRPDRAVFEVDDRVFDRRVVLKCLFAGSGHEEEAAFRAEFLLLDRLAHPYWAGCDDFGELTSGGLYFTLERARGRTLAHSPIRGWCPEVIEISRRILSALHTLHTIGYAQLDLKPEQILVHTTASGARGWQETLDGWSFPELEVKLIDLGLASALGRPCDVRGTPGYIAPELFEPGAIIDARADLYAFGAVLFELLTGTAPFAHAGPGIGDVVDAQLAGDVPKARLSAAGVPDGMVRLVADLLSVDPSERLESAEATWRELWANAPIGMALAVTPALDGSPTGAFIGRQPELRAFLEFLDREQPANGPRTVHLSGPPGVGKSRLLVRFRAVALTRGVPAWEPDSCAGVLAGLRLFESRELEPTEGQAESDHVGSALRLQLGPLPEGDLEQILESLAAYGANALREAVFLSAGNPGRAISLLAATPETWRAVLSVNLEDEAAGLTLASLPPPETWTEHAGWLWGQLSPESGALLGALSVADGLAELGDQLREAFAARVTGLAVRELLLPWMGDGCTLRSPLHARALRRSRGEASLRRDLTALSPQVQVERVPSASERVEAGCRIGAMDLVRTSIDEAIQTALASAFLPAALTLYRETDAQFGPYTTPCDASLRALLESAIYRHQLVSDGLPPRWQGLGEEGEPALHSCLRLWYAIGVQDAATAVRLIERLESGTPRELELLYLGLATRAAVMRRDEASGREYLRRMAELPSSVAWQEAIVLHSRLYLDLAVGARLDQIDWQGEFERVLAAAPEEFCLRARLTLGLCWVRLDDPERALQPLAAGEEYCRRFGLQTLRLSTLSNLARHYRYAGYVAEAATRTTKLAAIALALGRSTQAAQAIGDLSKLHSSLGESGKAIAEWSASRRLHQLAGQLAEPSSRVPLTILHASMVLNYDGQADHLVPDLLAALSTDGLPPPTQRQILLLLSTVHAYGERMVEAREWRARGLVLPAEGPSQDRAEHLWLLIDELHQPGSFGGMELISPLVALCASAQREAAIRTFPALGWCRLRGLLPGGEPEARRSFQEAANWALETGDLRDLWECHWGLGECALRRGDQGEARVQFARGRALLASTRATIPSRAGRDRFLLVPPRARFIERLRTLSV
ncbi:MAG: serine/threonine-protein kinase PknK [Candidatus Eisenbacteria bacterium]|nr:serine/threonine-protein kinase PknK [Candidatus Eisenbacteria bacterium]MCC7141170.1 serine/threonine-protein kinase PknK [Candidatus Eisenbacteria bacterium]